MVSWQERLVHARGQFSRSEGGCGARGHWSVLVEDSLQLIAEGQCGRDGQGGELVARLRALLCSSGGRRFRKLMCIHKQSPDSASDVHAGKINLTLVMATRSSCSGTQVVRLGRPR